MDRLPAMKTTLSIPVVASLFLLSFALPGDSIRFAVKEKSTLSKVFQDDAKFHSTSISVKIDGNDVGEGMDGFKLNFEETSRVEVKDEYVAVKDGKPKKLKRSFDKLDGKSTQHVELPAGAPGGAPEDESKDRSSELQGKTVVFTLDDEGEYKAAYDDGKGDAKLLERLKEDMDLRALLPDGAVETDKSWDIDVKAFHSVLGTPGGDMKLKVADDKDDDSALDDALQENVKGKAKGTYKGKRDVDGHKCAVIALTAELKTEGQKDSNEEGGHDGVMTMKIEYTVEGELLWDTEAGHFRSCTLSSKITLSMKNSLAMEQGSEKHEFERTTEFEGESEFKATVED
jgi:hypothetical protein